MDFKQSIDFLYRQLPMFSRVGAAAYKPGLDTSIALDTFFGHPHRRFKTIHVAGTNGKGSTSHTLASILQEQGYRTALYTSPHLVDFRERMRINGDMIPRDNVADFVNRFLESRYSGKPSFFELTMMMAFDWFASEHVDYAVIEVGMGGRLDSTNIITPIGCVITNISKDHTMFLGDTLTDIAREKAGIIKPGIPVVIGEADGDVRRVFEEKAQLEGAAISFAQDNMMLQEAVKTTDGVWKCLSSDGLSFNYPLGGDYQLKNINTALAAIDMLRNNGVHISDNSITKGMERVVHNTGLQGRWMTLSTSPLTIADTGHNEAGLRYNMQQLGNLLASRPDGARLHIVAGFVSDKAIDTILDLFPHDAIYYFTQAAIPRALDVNLLAEKAREHSLSGSAFHTVPEACNAAAAAAQPDDIIYIGGSTFVVADFLEDFQPLHDTL